LSASEFPRRKKHCSEKVVICELALNAIAKMTNDCPAEILEHPRLQVANIHELMSRELFSRLEIGVTGEVGRRDSGPIMIVPSSSSTHRSIQSASPQNPPLVYSVQRSPKQLPKRQRALLQKYAEFSNFVCAASNGTASPLALEHKIRYIPRV